MIIDANQLFPVQARWFVLLILVPYFWLPGIDLFYGHIDRIVPSLINNPFLDDQVYYFYLAAMQAIMIILAFTITKADWRLFFRPFYSRALAPAMEITGFSFVLSGCLIYLTFLPISFVAPDFITAWFIDTPPLLDVVDGKLPLVSNLLSFISLVALAPIIEEIIFRGVLLQRWGSKFGSKNAILLSSTLFGLLHTDPLGAFVFGVLMSYITIRSNTLLLPIVCHAANNFVVWLWVVADFAVYGDYQYTLDMFQSEWGYAIIFTIISGLWFYRLAPKIAPFDSWRLPKWF